jgi:hypothetical protein
MPEFIPVNVGNPVDRNLRELANECDCSTIYTLLYSPCSSVVHGCYDTLDNYYLRTCVNPFHGGHKIPYYWYKSPISDYGLANCLYLMDSAMFDILKEGGKKNITLQKMPGKLFLKELLCWT